MDIVKEEAKKEFPTLGEAALESIVDMIFGKIIPRLAAEAEEAPVKLGAAGITMIYPAFKPALDKLTDLNKDGK